MGVAVTTEKPSAKKGRGSWGKKEEVSTEYLCTNWTYERGIFFRFATMVRGNGALGRNEKKRGGKIYDKRRGTRRGGTRANAKKSQNRETGGEERGMGIAITGKKSRDTGTEAGRMVTKE